MVRSSIVGGGGCGGAEIATADDEGRMTAMKEVTDLVLASIDAVLSNLRAEVSPASAATLEPLLADIDAVRGEGVRQRWTGKDRSIER